MKVKLIDAQKGQQVEVDAIAIDREDNTSQASIKNHLTADVISTTVCRPISRLAKRLLRFARMARFLVDSDVINIGVQNSRSIQKGALWAKEQGWLAVVRILWQEGPDVQCLILHILS